MAIKPHEGHRRGRVAISLIEAPVPVGWAPGYNVCYRLDLWGDEVFIRYSSRPNRRMLREAIKEEKAWYLSFRGEPICEGC